MINDLHIRQRALNPQHSFIVQAPAGSGKTEILTQRYLVLLSQAKKAPEEIIAITFTRKAAAEMRARIISALEFSNQDEPSKNDYRHMTWSLAKNVLKKDEELNWSLIQNPNRLRILTIDALSALLCRQTPMLTQFGSTPIVCEDAKSLYALAAERCITTLLSDTETQPDIEYLLLHVDNHVEKLQELFSDLLSNRDQWLSHILYAYHHHQTLRNMLENSLQNIISEKIIVAQNNLPDPLKQSMILLARHAIADCADFTILEKNPIAWKTFANLFLTQEGLPRKMVDKRNGFSPKDENKSLMLATLTELENYPECIQSLKDIQNLPPKNYTDTQWETITALTKILPLLAAQLQLIFQEKNQIDFLELTIAAIKALGDEDSPTDLALYLDYKIQHLLIDEFQDTSVLHMQLLQKLISEWQPNDGRSLFLVGDPMQSIYRFRNAEVGLFLRVQQQGIAQLTLENLTLTSNFRSQENLISWFNTAFDCVFPKTADIATGSVPFTKATAMRAAIENNSAHFYPIINGNSKDEAKKIAEIIAMTREKNPDDSIALLVRSRPQLIEIISALKENHLPFQAIDIESLSEQPCIQDLLSLTRALLHRADKIAWLSILRAPFCGILSNDLEYIALAAENKTLWEALLDAENILELSQEALHRIQFLRHHILLAFQQQSLSNLSTWIENIWLALNGPASLSSESELEYTNTYFQLLESFDNIDMLTESCKNLFAKTKPAVKNPIQILTIHKAKGLEFDHVFLPGLHKTSRADQEKLLRWFERINDHGQNDLIIAPIKPVTEKKDVIYEYLKNIEKEKDDYETARLFYVAATRAKKSLHLFALLAWDEKKSAVKPPNKGTFLEKCWPILENDMQQATFFSSENESIKNIAEQELLLTRFTKNNFLFTEEKLVAPTKLITVKMDLTSHAASAVGTIVHEILQMMAEKKFIFDQNYLLTMRLKARLHALSVLESEMENCLSAILSAIKNILEDKRAQWILHSHHDAQCEWSITHYINNEMQHWIIDRSFIDEKNTRWIIDYKTAKPAENETIEKFLEIQKKEHEEKLNSYAATLSAMENKSIKIGLYFPMCCQWIEW